MKNTVGKYVVVRVLGKGGMATVYEARNPSLGMRVALKLLSTQHARTNPKLVERFKNEAKVLARFKHSNVVQVYDCGEDRGSHYIVMEFVEGGTLKDKWDGRPMKPQKAAQILARLADIMHDIHRLGIIHRDLKLANIFWIDDKTLKIGDFGIATVTKQPGITTTGKIVGTPSNMAPEQATGVVKGFGPETDIYGLGTILYELLTGKPPFGGSSLNEVLTKIATCEPPPPRSINRKVPGELEFICLKCLRKKQEERYGTALELADALRQFLKPEPVQSPRTSRPKLDRTRWIHKWLPASVGLFAVIAVALTFCFRPGAEDIGPTLPGAGVAQGKNPNSPIERAEDKTSAPSFKENMKPQEVETDRERALEKQKPKARNELNPKDEADGAGDGDDVPLPDQLIPDRVRRFVIPQAPWAQQPRPPRILVKLVKEFTGHTGRVRCLTFAANGKMLVSGSDDRTVRVWRVPEGDVVRELKGHKGPVSCVALSLDQGLIATGDSAGPFVMPIRIWKLATGEELKGCTFGRAGTSGELMALALSRDGSKLAVGGRWSVMLWDRITGQRKILKELRSSGDSAYALTFASNSNDDVLAVACHEFAANNSHIDTVSIWHLAPKSKKPVDLAADADLLGQNRGALALGPHGQRLAQVVPGGPRILANSAKLHVWELLPERKKEAVFDVPEGGTYAAVITLKGVIKVAAAKGMPAMHGIGPPGFGQPPPDSDVRLWDSDTRKPWTLDTAHKGAVVNVAFSPDGNFLATASDDCTVRLWDLTSLTSAKGNLKPAQGKGDQ